jgi:hypothetical protein
MGNHDLVDAAMTAEHRAEIELLVLRRQLRGQRRPVHGWVGRAARRRYRIEAQCLVCDAVLFEASNQYRLSARRVAQLAHHLRKHAEDSILARIEAVAASIAIHRLGCSQPSRCQTTEQFDKLVAARDRMLAVPALELSLYTDADQADDAR